MNTNKSKNKQTLTKYNQKKHRILHGTVVSDKMQKTVVVEVTRLKLNKKYKRRYRQSKRYKADDPQQNFKVGDKVSIIESRPLSKGKRWTVIYETKLKVKREK